MRPEHIVSSFDEDLNKIDSKILEMGGLIEHAFEGATRALKREDAELAKEILLIDAQINALEAEINEMVLVLIARRSPMATDLRSAIMTLRIAGQLERIGDYIKNVGRRTHTITSNDAFIGSTVTLIRMAKDAQSQIRSALDAFNRRDAELAEQVRQSDEQIDQIHNTLFRELLTYMMEDTRNISGCMQLLFIAKNVERIGDLAVDIAQEVIFMVTGEWPDEKRPKGDRTPRIVMDDPSQS